MPMFARTRGRAVAGRSLLLVLLPLLLPLLLAARPAAAERAVRSTFVYGELLGKGGPWGVGVERALVPRFAVGAVVSAAVIRDQQLYTLAPYAHATLARGRCHALFAELGAAIVHSRIPSPVAMWDGTSDTGAGGLVTLGWERAGERLGVRAYLAAAVGAGGLAPFGGVAIGARL
jgi:hypothetical protein